MIDNSVCWRLKLILWKNSMIRRHHYILTILEIGIPLLLFILLAYLRNTLHYFDSPYIAQPTYGSLRQSLYTGYDSRCLIYYAPKTEFTSELISEVQAKLSVNDEDVKGLKTESDLMVYYQRYGRNRCVRAVVFKNTDGQPKHLQYVLKPAPSGDDAYMGLTWDLEDLFSESGYSVDQGSDIYFQTGVLAMQLALDASYIKMTSGQDLPVDLTMQEFPYPPHYDDGGIRNMFQMGLPYVTILGFMLLFPIVVQQVMDEKITGIKELMKMMGLKSWMLWLGWFLNWMIVNVVSILLITLLMKVNVFGAEQPLLQYCSPMVFAVFLLFYCTTLITFAFMISSFFNRPTVAVIVGISIWMASQYIGKSPRIKLSTKVFVGMISPNMLLQYGYTEISKYESREIGSHWGNLFTPASNGNRDVTLGVVLLVFITSSVIFMVITMYMEAVKPGPYGLAKPPHFPVLYIWSKISKSNKVEDEEAPPAETNAKIEKAPKLKPGVAVKNLVKKFGKQTAVDGFSIDFYEGQITALLGHNGAGKTTTMSIITGMISATSGKVLINNLDIKHHMDKIRSCLGFCPQANLHFKDLNVSEHLIFFAMLKGSSLRRAKRETKALLEKMNLSAKEHSPASSLSGGMKRKLSLGMALIGNSKVLILDEPTSGLDPEARREIWDILLTFRGSRIVIITTHFMEEADVLGDRIAIMDHGKLMCYGTSMYLKKEYGAGYNLTLVRDAEAFKSLKPNSNQVEAITAVVKGRISSATLVSANGNRVSLLLPHDKKTSFGELLEAVENKKKELCITNIALSITTLEEVFLKAGSAAEEDSKKERPNDNESGDVLFTTNPSTKHKGLELMKMQVWTLFNKRWLVLKRKWMLYVVALMIAVAAAILTLFLGEPGEFGQSGGKFDFDLNNYGKTTVFYGAPRSDSVLANIQQKYKKVVETYGSTPKMVGSVSDTILFSGEHNIAFYKDLLIVAAEFNDTDGTALINAMFSNSALHGAPISLNLVTNAILKATVGNDHFISTSIAPLPSLEKAVLTGSSEESAIIWFLVFPLGVLLLTSIFLMFPHMERVSTVKQLQLMCGVRAVFYWLVCYIVDFALYLIAVALILISMLVYGLIGFNAFSGAKEMGTLFLILLAYGFAVIPYAYIFTYRRTAANAFVWYFNINFCLGIILALSPLIYDLKAGNYLIFLIPYVGMPLLLLKFSFKVIENYNWDKSNQKAENCFPIEFNPCCAGASTSACIEYRSYLSPTTNKFNYNHLMIMAASSILYFTVLLLLETNWVQKLRERVFVLIFEVTSRRKRDEVSVEEHRRDDVIAEEDRISDMLNHEEKPAPRFVIERNSNQRELLLVHKLQKRFILHRAVKGVSFAVKPGECFGLLGVNGAGKTTSFRILTGDLPLITGEARILTPTQERICLSRQPRKYLKNVGYCPQCDALNEVLTGREMLRVFADLRGINEGAEDEINMWLSILGLTEYADKPCGVYSGGNKRKLNVAMALIGGPPVVMLDEPTSGVDPVSRRKLWNTISAIQKQEVKPSIILTSHSMEESEALCNNLVIMKAGQLECYGTIPNIKQKYAQGYTVLLKLKMASARPELGIKAKTSASSQVQDAQSTRSEATSAGVSRGQPPSDQLAAVVVEDPPAVTNLMKAIQTQYGGLCTLKDKHTGVLLYHINDKNKKLSQMFKEIEQLQHKHPVIEDYNVSETTLEEVFLTIARGDD